MAANRGPYAKGVERREEILRVALEVVAEHGYRYAFNHEIAKRAGLSQAGLTHYFPSREELYMDLLRARDARDTATYWVPSPDFDGFLAIIAHNATVPGLVQLYVEFSAEASIGKHPAHGFFLERQVWLHEKFVAAVHSAQSNGEFGDGIDVDEIAEILMAAADGVQQQWLLDRSIDMVARLRTLWTALAASSRLESHALL